MPGNSDAHTRATPVARWSFDEGSGTTVSETISGATATITSVAVETKDKPNTVQWRDGVQNSCLLFDGYSTSIETTLDNVGATTDQLSVEAWVAPRSHGSHGTDRLEAVISQHALWKDQGFEFGLGPHGSCSFRVGLGCNTAEVSTDSRCVPTYEWSHIVGVFDGDNSSLSVFVNGVKVASKDLSEPGSISYADVSLLIGKSNKPTEQENQTGTASGVFDVGLFNGLIDELALYEDALTTDQIASHYEQIRSQHDGELPKAGIKEIGLDPSLYRDDHHRPEFHLIAPGHWMNEPHAPLYYDGQYHLFYQHNPKGPYWGNIHWGHWVSDDLVHWRHLPIALSPGPTDLDPDGIWSGNATYDEDGDPVLFYTAGNMANTPDQVVATATPADTTDPELVEWEKTNEVTIEKPRRIGLRENDFRDPYIWREDGRWLCLVGAGIRGGGGTALVYESKTLEEWQFKGHLFETDHDQYPELGTVWELPILLSLGEDSDGDEKYVFIISPVGAGADIEVYYWLGEWDADDYRFVPDTEDPQRIDYGDFGFTGPSAMRDPKTGRCILFTIAQDQRRPQDHFDAGWAHNGGLPLELYLTDDDQLGIDPIEELASLRQTELVNVSDQTLRSANEELTGVAGDILEISLEIDSGGASKYGIEIRKSPHGEEQTLIYYDEECERIYAHREENSSDVDVRSGLAKRSSLVHSGEFELDGGTLRLHLFLDKSMIECYVQSRKSITTRVYPTRPDATGLALWADGDVTVEAMQVWELEEIGL